jgi:RimJ/RimL family protein N-acetyltransferase
MRSLNPWIPPPRPARTVLAGQWCRLEPLDPERHVDSLFEASMAPGAEERFRWLFEVPRSRPSFGDWVLQASAGEDPLFFAVVDAATGRAEGRQALMRITPEHGVIEIGHILWGPSMARTRVATEALFLAARHVFDDLGYRRFEWKCNSRNEPSRRAALRFGFQFEGIFRQHMVHKGENRDTAWFAMTDGDWQQLKPGYERWLAPQNFDPNGQQRLSLAVALSQR